MVGDPYRGLYTAKAIAMEAYKDIKEDNQSFDLELTEEYILGNDFTIVSWFKNQPNGVVSYHMSAYNDECDVIYKIEMCSEGKDNKLLKKKFRDLLNSCQLKETR